MISKLEFLILFFLFAGCNSHVIKQQADNVTGFYKIEKQSLLKKISGRYLSNTLYPGNLSLKLNTDSTFVYTGCNRIIGKWQLNNNKLYLHCRENTNIANNEKRSCGHDPIILTVEYNKNQIKLIEYSILKEDNHRYKGVSIFIKEN